MNCTKIEALLPLYAEADLANESEQLAVSQHLRCCHGCAQLADRYRASQQWLHSSSPPPQFDAAFYNRIRSTVLTEINRELTAPTSFFSQLPAQLFRRRFLVAAPVVVVLLLIASALAVRVSLNKIDADVLPHPLIAFVNSSNANGRDPAVLIETKAETKAEMNVLRPEADDYPRVPQMRPTLSRGAFGTSAGRHSRPSKRTHRPSVELTIVKPTSAAPRGEVPFVAQLHTVVPEALHIDVDAAALIDGASLTTKMETPTQEMTRIEIQTSDPNIRIIWLAPKATD